MDLLKKSCGYFQCPGCGRITISIIPRKEDIAKCIKCKKESNIKDWRIVEIMQNALLCSKCNVEIELTSDNLDNMTGVQYKCYKCLETLAIKYRKAAIEWEKAFSPKWNKSLLHRTINIGGLNFLHCKHDKDILVLRLMHYMSTKEENDSYEIFGFRTFKKEEHKAGLILNSSKDKYLGYILWSEKWSKGDEPILRQIYIFKEERGKGYGTLIFKYWVEKIAKKVNKIFAIESPNSSTVSIISKLKYTDDDCFIVRSG